MSGPSRSGRSVNVIPITKIKKEVLDDVEDTVACKLCFRGYASQLALNNHVRMEHTEAYASGDPSVWTKPAENVKKDTKPKLWIKNKEGVFLSQMKPTDMTSLASSDVSYIIIKDEDGTSKKKTKQKKEEKMAVEEPPQAITGPFECLQPSTLVEDGTCHQIFFSCCEYSIHYRDEHTRRRKGVRCQVCEKPLACNGVEPLTPYNCETCGEGFETNNDLSEHTSKVHVKVKPYQCHVCQKRFTQVGGVLQHMRMHTGDRPYACSFCSKAFTQKSGLDQHLRIHTKVRPYRCVVCSKTFSQSVHLKQHMRTHTQVSPFQCGFCDKRFKQSSHLNYHLKNHNPANMSDDQKAKYSELIGMIAKDYVEIEVEQIEGEVYEQETEVEMESEEREINEEDMEERVIVEGQEVWISSIE